MTFPETPDDLPPTPQTQPQLSRHEPGPERFTASAEVDRPALVLFKQRSVIDVLIAGHSIQEKHRLDLEYVKRVQIPTSWRGLVSEPESAEVTNYTRAAVFPPGRSMYNTLQGVRAPGVVREHCVPFSMQRLSEAEYEFLREAPADVVEEQVRQRFALVSPARRVVMQVKSSLLRRKKARPPTLRPASA